MQTLPLIDVVVIVAVMAAVTWLGHRLSAGVQSRAAFFQADGTLPWWAVSGISGIVLLALTWFSGMIKLQEDIDEAA